MTRSQASLLGGSKLSEVAAEDELANGGHDAGWMLLELFFDISTLWRGFCQGVAGCNGREMLVGYWL